MDDEVWRVMVGPTVSFVGEYEVGLLGIRYGTREVDVLDFVELEVEQPQNLFVEVGLGRRVEVIGRVVEPVVARVLTDPIDRPDETGSVGRVADLRLTNGHTFDGR